MDCNVTCPGCKRDYTHTKADLKRNISVCPHCADTNTYSLPGGFRSATYNDVTKLSDFDLMMVIQQRVRILTELLNEATTRYNHQWAVHRLNKGIQALRENQT